MARRPTRSTGSESPDFPDRAPIPMQDEYYGRGPVRRGELAWCPGCDFEAPIEELSVEVLTFWRCPRCQWELRSLPADATDEYRELLRRY